MPTVQSRTGFVQIEQHMFLYFYHVSGLFRLYLASHGRDNLCQLGISTHSSGQPTRIRLTARLYAHNLHLTSPPMHGVLGQSTSIPTMWTVKPASAHNSPVLYIQLLITQIKPVHSEPLSVTVPVVIGTCTVLVGTVESIPIPPQKNICQTAIGWRIMQNWLTDF